MKRFLINHVKGRLITLFLFLILLLPFNAKAQQEEVLLAFRHPAVGHLYVNSLYDSRTNESFLPLIELFSLLEINFEADARGFTIRGNFITPNNPYTINLQAPSISFGKNTFTLAPEDFRIGATDYFLAPAVFEKIFGLNFTVNITQLTLTLETQHNLPVEERMARERARERVEGSQINREDFPLVYGRKRSVLSGTMMDYSVSGSYDGEAQNLGYTFTGGMEVLGGDMQGTFTGNHSGDGNNYYNTSGLRWRYAVLNNNYISGIMAGQISTTGLQPLSLKGIAITNDPIEPRRMFETYVVDGTTEPESEVEIYINEQLTDYKRANEVGYYRFDVPLTYGTTRVTLRIFTPTGQIIVSDKQLQVPFTFLPRGVVSYNVQAGQSDNKWADTLQNQWAAHGNVAMGISRWLTASVGAQHQGNEFVPGDLFYYSSISARIAKQYLLNIEVAPENFYRLSGSVMYTGNLSLNFIYTKYKGVSLFNARGATEDISANVFLPFTLFGLSTGLRVGGQHYVLPGNRLTQYTADFSTRAGPVNLRFNYRDNLVTMNEANYFGQGLLTTSLTYTIARSPGVPVYVQGMFVRGQAQYDLRKNAMQSVEMQLSKTFFRDARLQLGVTYNIERSALMTQVSFTLDLNKVRSTTMVNSSNSNVSARQNFTGSLGWDMPNKHISMGNRQQAGRGAAAVLLFVDNNSSGKYDAGDELLPYNGVKLDRSTIVQVGSDSILRLNQLQSYYLYNLSVNRNAINDPTLVPQKDKFSFIADPNQYKRIEIPFYRGGIIQGTALIEREGQQYGQGGLRIILKAVGHDNEQTVRSFNDGGFYFMDIAPGRYTIEVDQAQLGFLEVQQLQKTELEIKALAEGDFIEGLEIILSDISQK